VRSLDIARRYAKALHSLAVEEDCVDEIETAYERVLAEMSEVPRTRQFLAHPLVPRNAKQAFFEQAFPGIPEHLHSLFLLLVRNAREAYVDLIYEELCALRREEEGTVHVRVETAHALSEGERKRLRSLLESGLGQAVKLEEVVDPSLLGGARIDVAGKVVDGTLRARLGRLRDVLAG
jgi:F-type H+-transporting ATPase subunit delta